MAQQAGASVSAAVPYRRLPSSPGKVENTGWWHSACCCSRAAQLTEHCPEKAAVGGEEMGPVASWVQDTAPFCMMEQPKKSS